MGRRKKISWDDDTISPPAPKKLLDDEKMVGIGKAVDNLHRRILGQLRHGLTYKDILSIFCREEDVDSILHVNNLVAIADRNNFVRMAYLNSDRRYLQNPIIIQDNAGRLLPKLGVTWYDNILGKKLCDYLDAVLDIAVDFAKIKLVAKLVSEQCATFEQIRFLWSPISTLATMDSRLVKVAPKVAVFKPQNNFPALSPELRKACVETGGTVAKALMFKDGAEKPSDDMRIYYSSLSHVNCELGELAPNPNP